MFTISISSDGRTSMARINGAIRTPVTSVTSQATASSSYDFTDAPDKTIHRTLTLPTDRWVSSVAVTKTGIFVLGNTPGQPSVPDTIFSTYPVPARYRAVGVR